MMKGRKGMQTTATSRLRQDYLRLKREAIPYVTAEPCPSNMLEWHYVVRGPEKSPFEGGYFHGKLVFPREFPFKPPSIYMLTPNGRFKCNTRLCLSISDFHPETWNPAWSVATILQGLLSFMLETSPAFGSIDTSEQTKRTLASQSGEFNLSNPTFRELFPELVQEIEEKLARSREELSQSWSSGGRLEAEAGRSEVGAGAGQPQMPFGAGGGAWTNLCLLVFVAIFALTVRFVLRSVAFEDV